jgi:hypothetical protein
MNNTNPLYFALGIVTGAAGTWIIALGLQIFQK